MNKPSIVQTRTQTRSQRFKKTPLCKMQLYISFSRLKIAFQISSQRCQSRSLIYFHRYSCDCSMLFSSKRTPRTDVRDFSIFLLGKFLPEKIRAWQDCDTVARLLHGGCGNIKDSRGRHRTLPTFVCVRRVTDTMSRRLSTMGFANVLTPCSQPLSHARSTLLENEQLPEKKEDPCPSFFSSSSSSRSFSFFFFPFFFFFFIYRRFRGGGENT